MIAFLGTGLLGANFTKALLAKGHKVNVWNRTSAKAKVLQAEGAVAHETPADAVIGAAPGIAPGAFIIDHTTTTAKGAIERTQQWAERGINYVHAPVFMGPVNALDGSGYMLVSGDQSIIGKVLPWIEPMTGKVINFGDTVGKAAGIKLIGNLFLLTLTGGVSDMLALAKALDIDSSDIVSLFSEWNPGAGAPARLKRVIAAKWDEPSWELQMARKDARLMMEEAANGNKELVTVPAIAQEMDRWLDKGYAHKDWTVIAADNV